ncbi:hypothetical protein J4407_01630 [Candidatus Pacearchaeota archaeon]|nr:hypothetical protein [Candidatus Pacearchaeota archaeon]
MGKIKKGLLGLLGVATLVGTFGGNNKDVSVPPIFNEKVGTWGGINITTNGTEFAEGSRFYGISISSYHRPVDNNRNYFYGLQVGLHNSTSNLVGGQIGFTNYSNDPFNYNVPINGNSQTGFQLGGNNVAENLTGVQGGGVNINQEGASFILNYANLNLGVIE